MTAAPPDVRLLLEDLAAQVPSFDVADAALRTAHRRRRRRSIVAASVVVLTVLAVAALPAVGVDLPSGLNLANRGEAVTYEPDVEVPGSGVEDLPTTLDEPISMVLAGRFSGTGGNIVVTASGRVFQISGSSWWTATVSPDGHVLVWYDAAEHALVSRDLRDGTTHRYRPISHLDSARAGVEQPVIEDSYPGIWSQIGRAHV